jgi:hypothetical protein
VSSSGPCTRPASPQAAASPLTLAITNRGNVYALRNGLNVTDGPKPIVQFPGELVLADARTTATATWTSPPLFGFPAHLTLYSNGRAVATASVYIIPVWQVAGALALLVGLFLIWRIRRRAVHRRIDREVTRRIAPASSAPADQDVGINIIRPDHNE